MKKERRIGTITFGIVLVVLGILLCVSMFTNILDVRTIIRFWPVIFIILGIEILIYSLNKEIQIKYDVWGILLTIFIVFSAGIMGIIDYGINEFLLSDNVKNYIDQELGSSTYSYFFDNDKLEIKNTGNVIKSAQIIEDKSLDLIKVYIEVKNKEDKYFNRSNFRLLIDNDRSEGNLYITSGYEEKFVQEGKLIIYTPNKELINISGNNIEIIE